MMTCVLTLSLSPGLAFSVLALVSPSEDVAKKSGEWLQAVPGYLAKGHAECQGRHLTGLTCITFQSLARVAVPSEPLGLSRQE